jgi:hypothetical protein
MDFWHQVRRFLDEAKSKGFISAEDVERAQNLNDRAFKLGPSRTGEVKDLLLLDKLKEEFLDNEKYKFEQYCRRRRSENISQGTYRPDD